MLHQHSVGRCQIVGADNTSRVGPDLHEFGAHGLLPERSLNPVDRVVYVIATRAQIRVIDRIESTHQRVTLHLERPLSVTTTATNVLEIGRAHV